jgi:SPP1 gp7 family putative phage head morphogenesis protein
LPGPSDAQKSVEGFQRLLAAQDAKASAQVVRAYAPVYRQLQRDTQALVRVAQTQGLKPWQVMRMQRMKDLEKQFLAGASKFADAAGTTITNAQRTAVGLAKRSTRQAVAAGLPRGVTMENLANIGLSWNRLPDEAFTNFVGIAADGNPVGALLAPLGREAAGGVKDAIGTGIALGKGPRQTAQLVRVAAGMPLSKALLITRTETNRAFREATRLDYANNSQVVKGYRRLAAHSERTCMACIALDGTLYALDEPLNEHPNGRCALVPDTITYQDLGLDVEMPPQPENARDWLTRQSEDTQRNMLGNARYEAIQRGELHMSQLATVRQNAIWGDAAVVRPLRDLGLREGVPVRPPPRPPTPPRPTGDLVDPQTGLPVRGNRTTPPEPALPKEWKAEFGDPNDFLDMGSAGADPSMIKYRGATGREAIIAQVKEQEAWARAVRGAVEADYTGLSIKAARDVNLAIERTILRHNMRPLNRIATGPYSDDPRLAFNRAKAYQYLGNVHINLESTVNGSIRGWSEVAIKSQRRTVEKLAESRKALSELELDIATKRTIGRTDLAERRAIFERNHPGAKSGILDRVEAELQANEKKWRKAIRDHKTAMRDVESGEWSVSSMDRVRGIEDATLGRTIVHEIGHFAHRRYGFYDATSLETMATKTKTYNMVERMNPRTGRVTRTKKWDGSYEPQKEAGKISEYATTNDHEFFAEAWADYHVNDGVHLTDKVRAFIEEVIEANAQFVDVPAWDKARLGMLNRIRKRSGIEAARSIDIERRTGLGL